MIAQSLVTYHLKWNIFFFSFFFCVPVFGGTPVALVRGGQQLITMTDTRWLTDLPGRCEGEDAVKYTSFLKVKSCDSTEPNWHPKKNPVNPARLSLRMREGKEENGWNGWKQKDRAGKEPANYLLSSPNVYFVFSDQLIYFMN